MIKAVYEAVKEKEQKEARRKGEELRHGTKERCGGAHSGRGGWGGEQAGKPGVI